GNIELLAVAAAFLCERGAGGVHKLVVNLVGDVREELAAIARLPVGHVAANQLAEGVVHEHGGGAGRGVVETLLALAGNGAEVLFDESIKSVGGRAVAVAGLLQEQGDFTRSGHDRAWKEYETW